MGRKSRNIFKPAQDENGVYLHVYNHCVEGGSREYPFGDVEKEHFFKHLKNTLCLYSIECISAVAMSNHFHLILYIPKKTFSEKEMFQRIKKYRKQKIVFDVDDDYCQRRHQMSNDLSSFMKELQQGFTCWFNRTRSFRRRGTLWEQRFKCSKLIDSKALSTCLQYVELNPVRAEIVEEPSEYKFSSFGIWAHQGRHPFEKNFEHHMLSALRIYLESEDLNGLKKYYQERFKAIINSKSSSDDEKGRGVGSLLRRSRFWIDSLVLGSKSALREEAVRIWGEVRGRKKCFGKVLKDQDEEVMSIRQLIVDT